MLLSFQKIFMSDFELASINAVQAVFPGAIHFGCQFHFTQCLNRHLKTTGLTTKKVKENEHLKKWFRLFTTLSLVPKESFLESVELILLLRPEINDKETVSINNRLVYLNCSLDFLILISNIILEFQNRIVLEICSRLLG
jgi:hypothetical protein